MKINYSDSNLFIRLIAALGYIGIFWAIPLFLKKKDPYYLFHGKQGMVIFFFWAVILYLGWIIGWPVLLLAPILLFINIFAIWQTFKGRSWKIPVIGNIADKIGYAS